MANVIQGQPRWGWGLAMLVTTVLATPVAAAGPLERCLAKVAAGQHNAKADLCVTCPEIATTLRRQKIASMLDKPLRCPLALAEAADAVAYQHDVTQVLPAAKPSPATLARVLAELHLKPAAADGWWKRFRRWLRHWFTDEEGTFPPWLEEWLKSLSLPSWLGDVVFKVTLLTILVLAAIILFNEFRAVRWRGWAPRRAGSTVEVARGVRNVPRTLADVRVLPLRDQPGALLQYVIAQLVHVGRLPDRRDETNRKLVFRLRTHTPIVAASFGELVNDAERSIYGAYRLDDAGATVLWHKAQTVLAQCATDEPGAGAR